MKWSRRDGGFDRCCCRCVHGAGLVLSGRKQRLCRRVLVALEGNTIFVPSIWSLETVNAVLVGQRAKRLRQPDIQRSISLLESLPLAHDSPTIGEHISRVLPLAREYGLSAYDAAYLELSIRYEAPLATLDSRLQKAARVAGVRLFDGKSHS